jgi:hypothetical protein
MKIAFFSLTSIGSVVDESNVELKSNSWWMGSMRTVGHRGRDSSCWWGHDGGLTTWKCRDEWRCHPRKVSWLLPGAYTVIFLSNPNLSSLYRVVTPRCYCSSYSTSTVFIRWWLQCKPNSMKMVFSTNEVGSFWVNLKVWIFKLLCIVDH